MGQDESESESIQESVSRRRTLQGIGVGGASVIGGTGLVGTDLGVMGNDYAHPYKKYVPDVQVLHAKYRVENGQFKLNEYVSRGDVLNAIDTGDQLVDFEITDSDGDDIYSFEVSTSPYYMSKVVVTRKGTKQDPVPDEAKDHFEFNGGQPIECVYFFKKVYWQIDLLAGQDAVKKPPTYDAEDDNLIKAAMANSVDGVVDTSPLTKNYDAVLGGALQDRDIYFEVAAEWGPDPIVAAYLPELPDHPDVEEPDLVHTYKGEERIKITLAVYERTGPEGEGRGESFEPKLQRHIDDESGSVPFGVTPTKSNQWELEIEAETGTYYHPY